MFYCFLSLLAGLAQQIAQSLDFKTTIELARVPGVDLALFLKPPQPLKTADTSKVISQCNSCIPSIFSYNV